MKLDINLINKVKNQTILIKENLVQIFNILSLFLELLKNNLNIILKLYHGIFIPFLLNFINNPILSLNDSNKFRSKIVKQVYNCLLDIGDFEKNIQIKNIEVVDKDKIKDNSNIIFIQNHTTPLIDILVTIYLLKLYSKFPTAFIGIIFTSFDNQNVKIFFDSIINSLTENLANMIMIKWDDKLNKPVKNKIEDLLKQCNDILKTNQWNLVLYPNTIDDNKFFKFKKGFSEILKLKSVNYIAICSVVYLDNNNKILECNNNINKAKKISVRIEYIKNIGQDKLKLSRVCETIMNNNCEQIKSNLLSNNI